MISAGKNWSREKNERNYSLFFIDSHIEWMRCPINVLFSVSEKCFFCKHGDGFSPIKIIERHSLSRQYQQKQQQSGIFLLFVSIRKDHGFFLIRFEFFLIIINNHLQFWNY